MKIWKIAQYKPWEMTQSEFLDYHKTGDIPSHAYKSYETIEGLNWLKKEKYPILYSTKILGGHNIEFRKSGEKLKYVSTTDNDKWGNSDILRDKNGEAIMMSEEEMVKRGLPLEDTTIVAFDGNNAIGLASNEWGTDGIWVVKDYQKLGIGVYLLSELRKQFSDKRKIGQMTGSGSNMARSYHKKEVSEALQRGDFTASSPKYNEIMKDYPELINLNI